MIWKISRTMRGASPRLGSSSISSTGSHASARAISRMRCWPSARLPACSYR
ncbi:Uncharacterised protein [Bordetella pertussis]|nr:Uncharacterised protein [Bordetella pertussis]CFW50094.1 Uncharacterised protein [Bordetella pertussis]